MLNTRSHRRIAGTAANAAGLDVRVTYPVTSLKIAKLSLAALIASPSLLLLEHLGALVQHFGADGREFWITAVTACTF